MLNLKKMSHYLYLFFKVLCWVLPLMTMYLILFKLRLIIGLGAFSSFIAQNHYTIDSISSFTFVHRCIILLIEFIPISITVFICYKLALLFKLYRQNYLFEDKNIQLIKGISLLMISGELLEFVFQPLMSVALSFSNPSGQRFISIGIGSTNISTLITGIIIWVAAMIIQEAQKLKTDQQLTI